MESLSCACSFADHYSYRLANNFSCRRSITIIWRPAYCRLRLRNSSCWFCWNCSRFRFLFSSIWGWWSNKHVRGGLPLSLQELLTADSQLTVTSANTSSSPGSASASSVSKTATLPATPGAFPSASRFCSSSSWDLPFDLTTEKGGRQHHTPNGKTPANRKTICGWER